MWRSSRLLPVPPSPVIAKMLPGAIVKSRPRWTVSPREVMASPRTSIRAGRVGRTAASLTASPT